MASDSQITLQIKTLANKKFSLTVERTTSVAALKEVLANEHEMGDAKRLKAIHHGKILMDKQTLDQIKIKNNDIVVVMQSRKKKKPTKVVPASEPVPNPAPPISNQTQPPNQDQDMQAPDQPSTTETTDDNQTTSTTTSSNQPSSTGDPNALNTGANFESALNDLVNMGFDRAEAERALRAAYGNPARAAEYLLNGIPSQLQSQGGSQSQGQQPQPQGQQPQGQQPQGQQGQSQPTDQPESPQLSNTTGQSQPGGNGGLAGLNPQILHQFLQQLQQSHPELMQQLVQNPQAINQLLQENPQILTTLMQGMPRGGGTGDRRAPPGATRITLSPEDREAVNQLMGLGYNIQQAYEAWTVTGKNLEMAASYLFENFSGGGNG